MLLNILQDTEQPLTTKDYPAPNVDYAENEKFCVKPQNPLSLGAICSIAEVLEHAHKQRGDLLKKITESADLTGPEGQACRLLSQEWR